MSDGFQLTPSAVEDLDSIWCFIARDSQDAADRVETAIVNACRRLVRYPRLGNTRPDITRLPVRFWTVPKYSNYVIVYRQQNEKLQVIAILHGKRDAGKILDERL
jgi:antitoxin ParD1/3/4